MLSPFPGIDPYLEHPDLWAEVHNRLIVAIAIRGSSPPLTAFPGRSLGTTDGECDPI